MEESERQSKGKGRGQHREGLIPFTPGVSGNPKGMTKGTIIAPKTFTQICQVYGSEIDPETGKTNLQSLRDALWEHAKKGDSRAASLILDRIDPALKKIEIQGITADHGKEILNRLLRTTVLPTIAVSVVESHRVTIPLSIPANNGNVHTNGNGHHSLE